MAVENAGKPTDTGFVGSRTPNTQHQTITRSHSASGAMSGRQRVAYGVSFVQSKDNRLRQLRLQLKTRFPARIVRNKSMSDLDSGFDSIDSASGSSASGNGSSSPGSADVTDTEADADDDGAWMTYDYPFENLAMSGGGAKGYAYIGALKAFEDSGVFSKIKRVVGTSAGAVIGGMLVVNATPQEIADFFKCDVKKLFQDKNAALCLFIPRLLTRFGLNSGQRFYEFYGDFLEKKSGNADITFKEVYDKYGKELCVTVTNLSRMCSEYCHYTTTPDLSIRKAVRMSMSFPGIYQSMKEDLTGTGDNVYIDGGTLENYPVQYFDEVDPETKELISNDKTVGLYLVSEDQFSHQMWMNIFKKDLEQIPSYLPDTKLAKERLKDEIKRRKKLDENFDADQYLAKLKKDAYYKDGKAYMRHYVTYNKEQINIRGPKKYFRAMLSTLLLSQKHMLVKPSDLERTIGINCGYIDTKDTGIEVDDREFMIRQGYEQTRNFLQSFIARAKRSNDGNASLRKSAMHRVHSLPTAFLSFPEANVHGSLLPSPAEEEEMIVCCQDPKRQSGETTDGDVGRRLSEESSGDPDLSRDTAGRSDPGDRRRDVIAGASDERSASPSQSIDFDLSDSMSTKL